MTGDWIRRAGDLTLGWLCRFLAGWPLSPSAYGAIGAGWGFAAGALLWSDHHASSLVAIFLAGSFDYLDGGVSRWKYGPEEPGWQYATAFHLACDKISDAAIILGIALVGHTGWPSAIFAILSGVVLTLSKRFGPCRRNVDPEQSLFDRSDRILCLLILGVFSKWRAAVIVICVMNTIGVGQRVYATKAGSAQRGSRA